MLCRSGNFPSAMVSCLQNTLLHLQFQQCQDFKSGFIQCAYVVLKADYGEYANIYNS